MSSTIMAVDSSPFPAIVEPKVIAKNAKFAQLVELLAKNCLAPDGSSQELKKKFDQANARLEKEKRRGMQLRTIYDELKSFLMDIEMESDPRLAGNTDLMNYAEVLRSAIANVEAKELVDLTTTSFKTETTTTTLLGIDTEFFDMDEAEIAVSLHAMLPELCKYMVRKFETLIDFHPLKGEPIMNSEARVAQFVHTIQQFKGEVERDEAQLEAEKKTTDKIFWELYQMTGNILLILHHILSENKLKTQSQHDQVTIKWLQAKSATLIRKLSVLHHQILKDTYTPETVAALTEIRRHLTTKVQQTEQQYHKSCKELEQYEAAGQGFLALVKQYTAIIDQIADKRWALDQMLNGSIAGAELDRTLDTSFSFDDETKETL